MKNFILSIDQGTTGSTAALISADKFLFIDKVNTEFPQIFPEPGQVEHNLNDIWKSVEKSVIKVIGKNNVQPHQIIAIGITNQRETTCAFNKKGIPLANAIVWQDRRTENYCQELIKKGYSSKVKELTGLPIDAYFSGTKIKWLLENNTNVQEAAKKNDLYFGTIDTFLLYKLTGGGSYKTDASNSSRTLLADLSKGQWNKDLTSLFNIELKYLPEIVDSFGNFGVTKGLSFLPDGIPITGILGDQQSALFGQAGINPGDAKCTYGTGAFMLMNTGEKIQFSQRGLLTTIAYQYNGKISYALEGSCYIAGAAIQWLRDNLNFFTSSSECESFAQSITNDDEMKNILFLPFFTGIASPHWKSNAKAAIIGMTRDTNKYHLTRACLEGVAFSINDLLNSFKMDTNQIIKNLRVDGGMVANNFFCEIQSSVANLDIIRPRVIETTAYGAALAAGIGREILDLDHLQSFWKEERIFKPDNQKKHYFKNKYLQWENAIQKIY